MIEVNDPTDPKLRRILMHLQEHHGMQVCDCWCSPSSDCKVCGNFRTLVSFEIPIGTSCGPNCIFGAEPS